jgi:uncharacterized protein YceH (UPF0502 family)
MDIVLNDIEVRLLGSLMEKEVTTPEYYPLSLNGLINACNQKSNRSPVLSFDERTVASTLLSLKEKLLVYQSDASRVPKYWQDFVKQNNLISSEAALLCLLFLRGPQTVGELRNRCERLYSFENLEEVSQSLEDLSKIGFVIKLPLQPGRKEHRFAHLLAGSPGNIEQVVARQEPVMLEAKADNDRIAALEESVAYIKAEIEILRKEFFSFKEEFE